ncbi:potassium channel family protein [Thermococcus sp.]
MCRMAHFGNCDSETSDQGYCIFHKPNKSEEEAREFYRKFLERFKPRTEEIEVDGQKIKRLVFEEPVDARGFVFPEIPEEPIKYKDKDGNRWDQRFSFEYAVFKNDLRFSSSKFKGEFSFKGAIFEKYAGFKGCMFYREISFDNTYFKQGIRLNGSIFKEKCSFRRSCLGSSSLEDSFSIMAKTFERGVDFTNALFNSPLKCVKTVFKEKVTFERVKFNDGITFMNAKFHGVTSFKGAIFYESVKFIDGTIFSKMVSFDSALFKQRVYFTRCVFGNANFENSTFEDSVRFESVEFLNAVVFKGSLFKRIVYFEKTDFNGYLSFSNSTFQRGIQITKEYFKLPEAEIEARRVQRLSYEKEGKRDEADRMFVLEMRAKRELRMLQAKENFANARNFKNKLKAAMEYIRTWIGVQTEKVLADWITEYGTNWRRVLTSSVAVILGTALPYTLWSNYIDGFPASANVPIRFANALYYSLVTFTTLGYGDMHPTGWLKALSAIEALTGAVFMALIVAVIARKWMR